MDGLMILIVTAIILIVPVFWVSQAIWIYSDASKMGNEYGWLWALLSLMFFPVPLIVYLIIRSDNPKCPRCGNVVDKYHNSCPYCGHNTREICKKCGRSINKQWNYCPHCNEPIDK